MSTDNKPATMDAPALGEVASQDEHKGADWGEVNRELLAERLRKAYHAIDSQEWYYENYVATRPIEEAWINVANDAIAALLEGDPK